MANAAVAAAFFATFPTELAALRRQIQEGDESQSDATVQGLADARLRLQAAAPSLPSHDLQKYEEQLQSLQQELASKKQEARGKFRFRRERGKVTGCPKPAVDLHQHDPVDVQTCRSHETLDEQDVTTMKGTLSHLEACVVDLRTTKIPSLHLHHVSNTIILLGDIQGSVFFQHGSRCVLYGSVRQMRLVDVTDTAMFLETSSTITLETCKAIQIGRRDLSTPESNLSVQDFQAAFQEVSNWTPASVDAYSKLNKWLALAQESIPTISSNEQLLATIL
ncbi:hypothetical protein MYAM1_001661 [Malassezia yamatoensis]|uniref:C-CAP/cofactor C-like domain-containing protein n=1 Tax=Malassezia yamatoensis TaxID=253288 RepID=A0AAJ5YQU9_9BASI|nr:hypothetical protein MYAM1_001661 [Malassezia yamatoensis]